MAKLCAKGKAAAKRKFKIATSLQNDTTRITQYADLHRTWWGPKHHGSEITG